MKLRLVLALVIGPLFLLSGYLMFKDISDQKQILDRAHDITVITHEGAVADALVHELQKERGFSAGFIASKGKNFSNLLQKQREQTMQAIAGFEAEIVVLAIEKAETHQLIVERLNDLAATRNSVDTFALTVPEMAKFYTQTINDLLELGRPTSSQDANGRLQALVTARTLVGAAKESAGLERAMGATGLSGGFSLSVHDRFVSLNGAQIALLHEADGAMAGQGWLAGLHETDVYKRIADVRKTVAAGYETKDFGGITAQEWFKISTAWIDALRAEELSLLEKMEGFTATTEAQANASYRNILWSGLAISLAVLAFAIFSFERMVSRVKYLIEVINGFTNGEFNVFIKGIEGRDELSQMANAIYHFKQDTLEMRKGAEQLAEEGKKRKNEQDQVVSVLSESLGELAEGNLTVNLSDDFPEEYEKLRHDFNAAVSKLSDTLKTVRRTTLNVRSQSNGLGQSSEDLSRRIGNQASSLRQTASTLQDVTHSIRSAADSANGVQQTTEAARKEASESGEIVKQAVSAMSEISASSDQISNIIDVINGISFQTNLLALNAGVEAARAGEAGRGFAVVASEVRALAQRSAEAAREIQTLIGQSAEHVGNGVEFVNKAGGALERIVERVGQISHLVSEIAEGSSKQADELGDINTGVSKLDDVSQKNTVIVDQAKTTSEALSVDANHLEQLIEQFKLPGMGSEIEAKAA